MRWLSRKTARTEDRGSLPAGWWSPALHPEYPVTEEGALRIADAYACIRALADAAASLPLHVYRATDSGRVRTQGRTAELIERPAPATTTANLVGTLVAHLNTWGTPTSRCCGTRRARSTS